MKIQKLAIAVACLAMAAIASAEDATALMKKHCAEFDRAMKSKDIKWFDSIAAADYHELDAQGRKLTRKQAMDMMKMQFSAGEVSSISTKVVSAKQKGDTIVAMCTTSMSGKMMMSPKAKKQSMVTGTMTFQETWGKSGGKWQIHELKTLSQKMNVDGKPMKM